ncbi:FUBP1 [Cordylochernes scorpioides]|uniref:FUBP1 n=1 Tax=Cordylochernes scorpioides TaxID=51811 RepID=A0ABY6LKQ1_9ARAC|nr:FUBP1 [Cordylochernes scorpioides]
MPTRTYIAKSEKNASGFKAAKDRVTLLLCSNASGDRMLKPLLVNRSLKPRALKGKDLNTLPAHWMANKKAWVTTAIFTEWFNKCFVPEVENYMKEMGLEFKILLILDNAPDHVALAIAEIKSQTLNACWKAAWPECVSKRNESNRTTILTTDIISIAKEIGGEGFDDFGEHDIEELLVDEALNDDGILESMVDTTKDFETVDSELEDVTPLDEKLLREGLQLSERALKFQRDLKFCMSGYRKLYKELLKPSQRLITDYLVKEKKITEVPKEALPCRSDDVILSSSDESDLAPIHKRIRIHFAYGLSEVRVVYIFGYFLTTIVESLSVDAVERAKQVAAKLKSQVGPNASAASSVSSGGGSGGGGAPVGMSGDGGGMKRPLEPDNSMDMPKKMAVMQPPRSQMSNAIVHSEFKVPDSMVGLIIGRGGEQINRIQSDSGCKVQMAPDSGGSSERICTLTGTQSSIDKCKEILGQIVSSKMAEENQRPPRRRGGPPIPDGQTVVELMLPAGKSGLVIGKGGETIRNIQTVANVKMVVIQDASGNNNIEKPLRITGEPQNCEHAKQLVLEILNKNGAAGLNDLQRNRSRLEPGMQEVCYTIPANRCGIIIGKGGDSIRNIASQSGARIEISKMHSINDPNDKTFIIRGTPQQIEHVEHLFREKLGGDLPPPRVDITPGSYPPSQMAPQGQQSPYGPQQGQQGGPPAQQWGNPYQQQWPQQQQQPMPPTPQQQQPPSAAATDPNAAAWNAYYAQYYQYYKQQPGAGGQQQPPMGAQQGHMNNPQQPPMQQQPQSPIQQQQQTPAAAQQPQQQAGSQSGGQDYTQAWIQYYRANGMHKEADSLESQHRASQQQQQPKPQQAAAQGGPAAGQQWGGNYQQPQQQQPFPPQAAAGYQQQPAGYQQQPQQPPQQQYPPHPQQSGYPQGAGGYNGPPSWGPGNYNSQTGAPVAAPSQ